MPDPTDLLQQNIDSAYALADAVEAQGAECAALDTSDPVLLATAAQKLAAARAKLAEAQAELDKGNNDAARQKIKEAVALIAEAAALIAQAYGS